MHDVLGVGMNATDEDIKRAYKKLAMLHHPDRPGGDSETFQKIQNAYEFLSDPEKRRPPGFRVFPPKQFEVAVSVTLGEAWTGVTKKFRVTRKVLCKVCNGHGRFVNEVRMGPFTHTMHHPCHACSGQGESGAEEVVEFSSDFPKRMPNFWRFTFDNIVMTVRVEDHPVFTRVGTSRLEWKPQLSFEDSVNGTVITCPHFDGPFEVRTKDLDPVIDPRKRYELPGGVTATFDVKYPEKLST